MKPDEPLVRLERRLEDRRRHGAAEQASGGGEDPGKLTQVFGQPFHSVRDRRVGAFHVAADVEGTRERHGVVRDLAERGEVEDLVSRRKT